MSDTPSASSVRSPTWLTARLTRFAFSGCDDEHSQAQRRVGVRLPDSAGGGVGCHREGSPGWPPPTPNGETPGAWIGSGMAGIDGLSARDPVTAEQMRALFGAGMHPLAATRLDQLDVADFTDTNVRSAIRLGAPFKVYGGDVSPFRVEVARRIATRHGAVGQLRADLVSPARRARPGPRKARGSHSDQTCDHDLTRTAATEAALGAASGVRPEPLKPRQIATRRSVSVGCVAEPPANHSQSPARPPRV
jgi:hypothetical protein